jgi:hypothetical protein
MDLGIKELGITFLIGAFTILGLELILYYFFNIQLTGFFQGRLGLEEDLPVNEDNNQNAHKARDGRHDRGEIKEQTMKTAVFIGLAFAIGILAEDLSYKYVDSIQTPLKAVPAIILPDELINTLDLPSKYDSRVKTLIHDPKGNPHARPLAKDLARNGAFSLTDPDHGMKVESWIMNPQGCKSTETGIDTCPTLDEITGSVLKLYYHAKNRAYDRENYYDEMKRIQTRLEFSRSISMIAFVYFVLGLLLLIPLFINSRRNRKTKVTRDERRKIYVRVPAVLLILFFVFFFSIWAYERESDEFNKRAFGYYSSMLITEKNKPAENKIGQQ